MEKIRKILAPTDLSELSRLGVRHALNLARDLGAEVTVYHVVDYGEILNYSREIEEGGIGSNRFRPLQQLMERYRLALSHFLRESFSDLLPLVEVREKVEFGRPDSNIVEEAKKEGVNLIVISTHGRTGLSHMLMGSVTEKVVRYAPCPVLSIRPQLEEKVAEKAAAAG